MSLGYLHLFNSRHLVAAKYLNALGAPLHILGALTDRRISRLIHIGARYIFRAVDAHLIAALGRKAGIGDKEIVIFAGTYYIRRLPGIIMPSCYLRPEIGIRHVFLRLIFCLIIPQPRICIQLQHVDSCGPGSVCHIKIPLVVITHIGIDGIDTGVRSGFVAGQVGALPQHPVHIRL